MNTRIQDVLFKQFIQPCGYIAGLLSLAVELNPAPDWCNCAPIDTSAETHPAGIWKYPRKNMGFFFLSNFFTSSLPLKR